jgi:hypothetical protein
MNRKDMAKYGGYVSNQCLGCETKLVIRILQSIILPTDWRKRSTFRLSVAHAIAFVPLSGSGSFIVDQRHHNANSNSFSKSVL